MLLATTVGEQLPIKVRFEDVKQDGKLNAVLTSSKYKTLEISLTGSLSLADEKLMHSPIELHTNRGGIGSFELRSGKTLNLNLIKLGLTLDGSFLVGSTYSHDRILLIVGDRPIPSDFSYGHLTKLELAEHKAIQAVLPVVEDLNRKLATVTRSTSGRRLNQRELADLLAEIQKSSKRKLA